MNLQPGAEMGRLDAEAPRGVQPVAETAHLDAAVPLLVPTAAIEAPTVEAGGVEATEETDLEIDPQDAKVQAAVVAVIEFLQLALKGTRALAQPMVQLVHLDAELPAGLQAGAQMGRLDAEPPAGGQARAQMSHLDAELPAGLQTSAQTGHLDAELPAGLQTGAQMGHLDVPPLSPTPPTAATALAAAAPGATPPTVADAPAPPPTPQPGGTLASDAGLFHDIEPLKGSVRLASLRGARLVVPMDDGSAVRARVDVVDDAVDVALRGSPETGLVADQRVGELREALARQGLELRNFDVAADAGQDGAGPHAGTDGGEGRPQPDAVPGRPLAGTERHAVGPSIESVPTPYSAADDLGRGGLLSRRF